MQDKGVLGVSVLSAMLVLVLVQCTCAHLTVQKSINITGRVRLVFPRISRGHTCTDSLLFHEQLPPGIEGFVSEAPAHSVTLIDFFSRPYAGKLRFKKKRGRHSYKQHCERCRVASRSILFLSVLNERTHAPTASADAFLHGLFCVSEYECGL